jgi:light-independent protochlorophyllide reductase subunit B
VDANYLTGKRVFVFGDATHACAAARIVTEELGFDLVGLGTYSREYAREVRDAAKRYGIEALITDDYLEVEARVAELQPELVLGSQMERHIAKRLGIPCAVISAPTHVQDYPARYAPQMGFEGANVIFDTWVHPLMMGLEEHLLRMFRSDFEFREPDHAAAQETPAGGSPVEALAAAGVATVALEPGALHSGLASDTTSTPTGAAAAPVLQWTAEAEKELHGIPFFVRGKARRNTERFAQTRGLSVITIETLYDAKAHFSR